MSSGLSERGKTVLIVDGFKFGFQKLLANELKRWTCNKKICSAYLKTNLINEIQFDISNITHTCTKDSEQKINRQIVSNNLKRKALEQLTERPSKLLHEEIKSHNVNTSTLTTTDVSYIKNNMHHARTSVYPKLPQDLNEVHTVLDSIEVNTVLGENFLLLNDISNGIVMFSCDENIQFLSKLHTLYVDGTFNYCAKYFCQLFTIHGIHNDHYIPLVFFLLKDKNQITYKRAFIELKNYCLKFTQVFEPEMIFVDFEKAIHNAILEVWTKVKIMGCRFHLGQSWWRKIQTIGLTTDYSKDNEVGKYISYVFGLPFLNPEQVGT